MKFLIAAMSLLILGALPAQAQLSLVYGSLRQALENAMAQTIPPYGKQPQDKKTGDDGKAQTDASASREDQDKAASGPPPQPSGTD